MKYIKNIDFYALVFSQPLRPQGDSFTTILTYAFSKFVPTKKFTLRPKDQPWTNTYTRLLLTKKIGTIEFFKMANAKYLNATNSSNHSPEFITQLLLSKINKYHKYQESNAQSTYANKKAKNNFYNSVNATMNNPFFHQKINSQF